MYMYMCVLNKNNYNRDRLVCTCTCVYLPSLLYLFLHIFIYTCITCKLHVCTHVQYVDTFDVRSFNFDPDLIVSALGDDKAECDLRRYDLTCPSVYT